ncbi:MAG: hypothetical protein U1F60_11265 [Planctomycetota bacterium]
MPDALFDRLASFRIDPPGVALPFARRLAHENGWSRAFAERAVAEYRRFVWLAMRAGHPVTPSPAVDEVWHLHLCYTRSYWDELCGRVLGRPLHHGPTLGGAAEGAKFADWYARTLASYRQHFGEPPADLWPAPTERFLGGIPRKVSARSHWIVPKARVRALLGGGARVAALALVMLLTAGCTDASTDSVVLVGLLVVFAVFLVVFVLMAVRVRAAGRRSGNVPRRKRGDGDSDCGSDVGCGFASSGGRHHGLHGAGAGATGIPPAVPDGDGHGGHGKGGHGHRGHAHGHDDGDGHSKGTGHGHEESGGDSGGGAGDSGGGGDSGGSSGCGGGGCGGGGGGD